MWVLLHKYSIVGFLITKERGSPCGVVANVLDFDIVVSEFELMSHYYVYIPTIRLGKALIPLVLSAMS